MMERAKGHFERLGVGPVPPTPHDLSARVLARLRAQGWVKGERSSDGKICLLGAYAEELWGEPGAGVPISMFTNLRNVILEQYPDRYVANDLFTVPTFNDDPEITWDDVEKVLEKAVAKEQELGS
jgi:hypothetical protein